MDQQRQYVIAVPECHEIIGKSIRIYADRYTAGQLCHSSRHSVKVQPDISHQALRGRGLCPVGMKVVIVNSLHNRIRIIYGFHIAKSISIIPSLHQHEITMLLCAEFLYLIFCKSHVLCKLPRCNRREFLKIRDRRLTPVLLDRQNSCHIHSRKNSVRSAAALKQRPQKLQILSLQLRFFPDRRIPLVNDHDKFIPRQFDSPNHSRRQFIADFQRRIRLGQFFHDLPADISRHIPKTIAKRFYISHIHIDHIILVQIFPVASVQFIVSGDLQIIEQ